MITFSGFANFAFKIMKISIAGLFNGRTSYVNTFLIFPIKKTTKQSSEEMLLPLKEKYVLRFFRAFN